jgi:hypothetical protein
MIMALTRWPEPDLPVIKLQELDQFTPAAIGISGRARLARDPFPFKTATFSSATPLR